MSCKKNLYSYINERGENLVVDYINRLTPKHQNKIFESLWMLQTQPDIFHPPYVKAFRTQRYKGIYELRTRIRQMSRILFVCADDNSIILLHGFIKTHHRTTEQALEQARARWLALTSGNASKTEFLLRRQNN